MPFGGGLISSIQISWWGYCANPHCANLLTFLLYAIDKYPISSSLWYTLWITLC